MCNISALLLVVDCVSIHIFMVVIGSKDKFIWYSPAKSPSREGNLF